MSSIPKIKIPPPTGDAERDVYCKNVIDELNAMLRHGASLNSLSSIGCSYVHFYSTNYVVLRAMLESGLANANVKSLVMETPLMYCMRALSWVPECSDVLLEHGANIQEVNRFGENALRIALDYQNWRESIPYLIKNGIKYVKKETKELLRLEFAFDLYSLILLCAPLYSPRLARVKWMTGDCVKRLKDFLFSPFTPPPRDPLSYSYVPNFT